MQQDAVIGKCSCLKQNTYRLIISLVQELESGLVSWFGFKVIHELAGKKSTRTIRVLDKGFFLIVLKLGCDIG